MNADGNGYQTNGPETTFHFHSPPSQLNGWSAKSLTVQPENFGILASSQITDSLHPGESIKVYSAYSVHQKNGLLPSEQVDYALSRLPEIQLIFDNGFKSTGVHPQMCATDCVWPGDLDNNGMVNNLDILAFGVRNGFSGPARPALFFGWVPLLSDNWTLKDSLSANTKHTDANGDGLISIKDAEVVSKNIYRTRPGYLHWGGSNELGQELHIERIYNSWTGPDSIIGNGSPILGRFNFSNPSNEPVYGLGFSIRFDTTIVTWLNGNNPVKFMDHPFLNTTYQSVFYREDGLDIAITRTDGKPISVDQMTMFDLALMIRSDIPNSPISSTTLHFQNYLLLNKDGHSIPLGAKNLQIPFSGTTSIEYQKIINKRFITIPNPGNLECHVFAPFPIHSLEIYDLSGRCVSKHNSEGQYDYKINTSGMPSGLYFIIAYDEHGNDYQTKWIKD